MVARHRLDPRDVAGIAVDGSRGDAGVVGFEADVQPRLRDRRKALFGDVVGGPIGQINAQRHERLTLQFAENVVGCHKVIIHVDSRGCLTGQSACSQENRVKQPILHPCRYRSAPVCC